MKVLKLVGAASFSCLPHGVINVKLGDTVSVSDEGGSYLLGMTYSDPAGNQYPIFTENLEAPTIYRKRAISMDMIDAVRAGKSSAKATGGAKATRAKRTRRVPSPEAA